MMRLKILLNLVLVASSMPACILVFAGDDGLYDAPPPPDAAFIRVLNGTEDPTPLALAMQNADVKVQAHQVSPYAMLKAGDVVVKGMSTDIPLSLNAGGYYTLAIANAAASKLFADTPPEDPAKSRIYFYNLSDRENVDLFVPVAAKNAIDDVSPQGAASVELKAPLQIDMVAKSDSGELAHFDAVALKRRSTLTIAVFGSNGHYSGLMQPNAIGRLTSN
jgi:Alginate O-acetyl transferase AlgF